MIKKLVLTLEYQTFCIWKYDEDDYPIDNAIPEHWDNVEELVNTFLAVSDLYDSFFIDNKYEFKYKGCPDIETKNKLIELFNKAYNLLIEKNNGEYLIDNRVNFDEIELESEIKKAEEEKQKPHIEVLLAYNLYPVRVMGDDGNYHNSNPKEWKNCEEMTDLFWQVSKIYSSFYVEDYRGFYYNGCPDIETKNKLMELFNKAYEMLIEKNNGKLPVDNQVDFDDIELDDDED